MFYGFFKRFELELLRNLGQLDQSAALVLPKVGGVFDAEGGAGEDLYGPRLVSVHLDHPLDLVYAYEVASLVIMRNALVEGHHTGLAVCDVANVVRKWRFAVSVKYFKSFPVICKG